MFVISCTFLGLLLFLLGSSGNGLCILVYLRQKFRHRIITPYFIILLFADSIYLFFRLIKLFYYSQTLFNQKIQSKQSCSNTFIARIYQQATQTWPQIFVPLIHSETYMRFSIILMCIISVQRTTFLTRSLKHLVLPSTYNDKHKHKWTFLFIILAFILSYIFEFFGLTLFCSKTSNRNISYQWFIYMSKYMKNSTYLLTNTITNQSNAYECILINLKNVNHDKNNICTKEELIDILSYYFDQHQRSIVNLIQKIVFHQTGQRITRNEIRRKYHFHECLFPQQVNFFHQYYHFMYNRTFGFNRYTFILVFGSVFPSLMTIVSNILSVYQIRRLNRLTSYYILPCRRRTDDTRRILLVVTIECLFAVINSWFSDILISFISCKGTLLADDDCPTYLRKNYDLLILFDMFNSISNIILHCLCSKHFRKEFYQILKSIFNHLCCCYFQNHCQGNISYHASITENASSTRLYLNIQTSLPKKCWNFNRRPLVASRQYFSTISQRSFAVHYHSLIQKYS